MTTITHQDRAFPPWPGTADGGSYFMRTGIRERHSIGYGRASHNPKQGQGIQDSADEQARQYRQFCADFGTKNLGVHLDPNASAGITARKARQNFEQAMTQVRTDPRVEVVWCMTSSRLGRGDIPFDEMIGTLADNGVLLAIGDTLYNPANYVDKESKLLGMYVTDRQATIAPKLGALGGMQRARLDGRPSCRPPYGLRRDRNQVPAWDVPDDRHPEGQPAPADVVREIFARTEAGEPASAIARDLEARQVLTPYAAYGLPTKAGPFAWGRPTVLHIAQHPAYIGKRRAGGRDLEDVQAHIDPLITEPQFWSAQQAIKSHRHPGRAYSARHPEPSLLAAIAQCGVCGSALTNSSSHGRRSYACRMRSHVTIAQHQLDRYVTARVIDWLASDARKLATEASEDDTAEAEAARGQIAKWQHQIDQLRAERDANPGRVNHLDISRSIELLQTEQQQAEQRLGPSPLHPLLASARGADAARKWKDYSPAERRLLVSMIAGVTLLPAVFPGARSEPITRRVRWEWKMTGQDGQPAGPPDPDPQPWVPARAERIRAIAAWLAAQDGPRTVNQIAAALGGHPGTVNATARAGAEAGQLTRESVLSNGRNTYYYQATGE